MHNDKSDIIVWEAHSRDDHGCDVSVFAELEGRRVTFRGNWDADYELVWDPEGPKTVRGAPAPAIHELLAKAVHEQALHPDSEVEADRAAYAHRVKGRAKRQAHRDRIRKKEAAEVEARRCRLRVLALGQDPGDYPLAVVVKGPDGVR